MLLLLSAACSAETPERTAPTGLAGAPAVDAGVIAPPPPVCEADNPFCRPDMPIVTGTSTPTAPTAPTPTDCGTVPIDLRPAGANIMVAVDGAAGMAKHWTNIQTAVRSLRERHAQATFGVQLFWADAIDLWSGQTNMNMSNNGCSMLHNKLLDVGGHSSQQLIEFLGTKPPGGTITDAYQVAPIIDSLSHYVSNASKLADPQRTNYLLVVTTGNDNCFGSAFADKEVKAVAYQKLAIELRRLNIRTIPIGVDPPSARPAGDPMGPVGTGTFTGIPGFGGSATLPPTDYAALQTLLEYGGSGLKEVPRIDTPAKLTELVSEVGRTVSNCRFEIPAALDSSTAVNPFELTFRINGVEVPRDRHQKNGWDFVNDTTTSVEFFGQGCQALQAGQNVVANKSCRQDICGTAAVNVQTKPRSVLVLLDSSLSRIECADGSLGCITMQPGAAGRPLTFWETVQRALGTALVAPVNDDVAFGIQFFPGKTAENLSCEVATKPEIAPERGKQIALMKAMLEKFPLGLSPVVGAMESVAAAPGKLADPGVVGAVVLLSDGGDNCSGATQPQIVMRLGAAAKKLSDAGVKTYAIRYGSAEGQTDAQAEQLTAIVTQGGTAISGGKTPYVDAKSKDELSQALANISDRLASCAFPVEGIKPGVDKDRANLFLNGQQVGLDKPGTKQNGWNWTNPERTAIELYGEACTSFKTSRHTRVAVEFGCEPAVVIGPQ